MKSFVFKTAFIRFDQIARRLFTLALNLSRIYFCLLKCLRNYLPAHCPRPFHPWFPAARNDRSAAILFIHSFVRSFVHSSFPWFEKVDEPRTSISRVFCLDLCCQNFASFSFNIFNGVLEKGFEDPCVALACINFARRFKKELTVRHGLYIEVIYEDDTRLFNYTRCFAR